MRVGRPAGASIVEEYVAGREQAVRFFGRDWRDPSSYADRAAAVGERFDRALRRRAAEAVHAEHPAAAEKLERVVSGGGFFVTTGQQPGLFGGPLYSLYKALTAVRLASELEERLDVPVQPLFWIASEDHDWDEAHETWVIDVENDLRHLTLPRPAGVEGDPALHRIPLDATVEEALGDFLATLPETDFSAAYAARLRTAWTPGTTLPAGFLATLEPLLAPRGVAFVMAHDATLKDASIPLMKAEIEGAADHEAALRARATELDEAGYGVQVPILEGGVNLFVQGPAGRERLYRDDDGFHLRHSGRSLTGEELDALLEEAPGTVSPNVLLRPLVEAAVFPTVAYVAGPGEIAYYAQLPPLYGALDVDAPVVHPRFSVTLVESKIGKVLEKLDLDLETLARPFHEIAGDVARDEIPEEAERTLGELRGAVGRKTGELQGAVRELDPTLKGPISHARSVIFEALDDVEKKIVQAAKRESEIALRQVEKAQLHLFPDGKPQERRMNPSYYLFRYGERLIDDLLDALGPALPTSRGKG